MYREEKKDLILKLLYFLIAIFFFLSFRNSIECIFQELILDKLTPFIYQIDFLTFNILLLILIVVFMLKEVIPKFSNSYVLNLEHLFFVISIILIWLYRFQGHFLDYYFIPIYNKSFIYYYDLILIMPISYLAIYAKSKLSKKKPSNDDNSILKEDSPIVFNSDDPYNRFHLVELLKNEIESFDNKESFAILITGPWGIGKTSFIKTLKNELSSERFITIDFKPWYNTSSKNIIQDFFITVDYNLQNHISLSNDFLKYGERISNVSEHYFSRLIKAFFIAFQNNTPAFDKYKRINDKLNALNKKIIIFIDDLDRLDKLEIIEVLRLIRNAAAFDKFIFIATFDKGYVLSAVKDFNEYNYHLFLEKIFSFELPLIQSEAYRFVKHFIEDLENYLKKGKFEMQETKLLNLVEFIKKNQDFIFNYINTNRDKIRFFNSFFFNFKIASKEVEIEDFFLIEMLKLKFSQVYRLIYTQKNDFLFINSFEGNNFSRDYQLLMKDNKYKINSYLLDNYAQCSINIDDINKIHELLDFIFCGGIHNKSNRTINSHSITKESRFIFYFLFDSLELMSKYELEEFIEKLLKFSEEELVEQLYEFICKGKFKDLYEKLESLDFTKYESEKFKKLFSVIYRLSQHQYLDENIKNSFLDLFKRRIIDEWKLNISLKTIDENDFKSYFLTLLVEKTDKPFVATSRLLVQIIRRYIDDEEYKFLLTKEECQNIQLKYLKLYTKDLPGVSELVFELYQNCFHDITREERKIILIPNANEIFLNYIKERPVEYLQFIIVDNQELFSDERPFKTLRAFVNQTFENYKNPKNGYDGFNEFLKEIESSHAKNDVVKRVRNFYNEFIVNDFKPIQFVE
ncbi:MAG: P-loop NTPase fold protein [Bacteroidota bacterium]|nr:P-loop NTPase fold protein [Bacteroidota bacterium]